MLMFVRSDNEYGKIRDPNYATGKRAGYPNLIRYPPEKGPDNTNHHKYVCAGCLTPPSDLCDYLQDSEAPLQWCKRG